MNCGRGPAAEIDYLVVAPTKTKRVNIYLHDRSKVWGHPDNFVSSMKTHFYLSNELKIE